MAKELTIKAKATEAKAEAKDEAKEAEQTAKKSAAVKLAGTTQKIKKQAATDKQKTAAAPAKEAAKRCIVNCPGARAVLVSTSLFFAITMAFWSNSSMSTGEVKVVTTTSVSSWADASNDPQCKIHDDNGVRNDFTAVQEAFETICPADAAKGFGRSASLDAAAAEGAGLRVGKEEGVACPPQWLPVLLASLGSPPRPSPPPPSPLPKAPAVCGSYNQTDCEATKMPGLKVVSELYAVRLQRIHPAARLRAC